MARFHTAVALAVVTIGPACSVPAESPEPPAADPQAHPNAVVEKTPEPAPPQDADDPTIYVMRSMQEDTGDWRTNLLTWEEPSSNNAGGTLTTMHEGRAWTAYPGGGTHHDETTGLPYAGMRLTYCALRALGAGTIQPEPLVDVEHHVRVEIDQSLTLFDIQPDLGTHYRLCAEFVYSELKAEPTTPAGEVIEYISMSFYDPSDP